MIKNLKWSFGFTFLILGLISCLETDLETQDIVFSDDVIFIGQELSIDSYSRDHVRIIGITPAGNEWKMIVEYNGGCMEHLFYVYWDGSYDINSYNQVTLDLFLLHDKNGDECLTLVRDTLNFTLNQALNNDYPFSTLPVVTVINESFNQTIEVDPKISDWVNGYCVNKVNYVENLCTIGPTAGTWIQPTDSIASPEAIWFHPVWLSPEVSASDIKAGAALVDVTLLFGYEYQNISDDCALWPDGTVIPVTINCSQPE